MTKEDILARFAQIDSKIGKAFEFAKLTKASVESLKEKVELLKNSMATASKKEVKEAITELIKLRERGKAK
jgi:FtsZ-binding cell division protein ZapB